MKIYPEGCQIPAWILQLVEFKYGIYTGVEE